MTGRARASRLAAALGSTLAAAALLVPFVPLAGAQGRPARLTAGSVAITVDDVQPTVLPTDANQHPFNVTLTVVNRTEQDLNGLTIEAERGEPINSQTQLDQAVKHLVPPAGHVVPVTTKTPLQVDLPAGARTQVVFSTTTSTSFPTGLCNCTSADLPALVYPLYFTAHVKGAGGVDQSMGLADTFVPAFRQAPAPVHVSWVWPLIDQPHLLDDTAAGRTGPVFSDDFLAASVNAGGRLDRALAVAERVARDPAKPPLTLLVDPELLEELEIMASGPYQVQTGSTSHTAGTGQAVAKAWLSRFRAMLDSAPQLRLQLTPYADPDVESLQANGLGWSATMPATMRQRVEQALGRAAPDTTLAWPVAGAVSHSTLTALVQHGVGTLLLNYGAVAKPEEPVRPGLARLRNSGRDVAVGLLDPNLERYAQQAVTLGNVGAGALPLLTSELAIRAVEDPTTDHVAVLAPPRWVDPDVATAARAIVSTSRSLVTRPVALADAVGGELLPNPTSHLAALPASVSALPGVSLAAARKVGDDLPALQAILTPPPPQTIPPTAQAMLEQLPVESQRVAASAWGRPGNLQGAASFAARLTMFVEGLTDGVKIVTPSSGSYTLASENSPLPITVRNDLPWPVTIQVSVSTVNGLPGFSAKPTKETVGAHQKATLHLPTKIDRTGRIRVTASLETPDGNRAIGEPVVMTVRSTALGIVGVIITAVAGTVLVLALLVRFGRRLQRRMRRPDPGRPRWDPDAPDAERTFAETLGRTVRPPAGRAP